MQTKMQLTARVSAYVPRPPKYPSETDSNAGMSLPGGCSLPFQNLSMLAVPALTAGVTVEYGDLRAANMHEKAAATMIVVETPFKVMQATMGEKLRVIEGSEYNDE